MQIKTLIEKEDGTYEFQADLTSDQHKFLLEYAIKTLFVQGMLPFAERNSSLIVPVLENSALDTNGMPKLQ